MRAPHIIVCFIISLLLSNEINLLSGDIHRFSIMNAGVPSHQHYRNSFNEANYYSISFIHLPVNVNFGEVFYNFDFVNTNISSSIGILDWGELNSTNNSSTASEKKFQISFLKEGNFQLNYFGSIAYYWSNIQNYKSSSLEYNFGVDQSFFNNNLIIGFALENYNKPIKNYSNVESNIKPRYHYSVELKPKYINAHIYLDYINSSDNFSEVILGLNGEFNDFLSISSGKIFYLDNLSIDNDYTIFDNLGFGVQCNIKHYRVNFGIQLLTSSIMNVGTSLSYSIK